MLDANKSSVYFITYAERLQSHYHLIIFKSLITFMKNSSSPKDSLAALAEENRALKLELEATRKKLRFVETLVDNIPFPLFSKDEQGALQSVNKAYEDFFSINRNTILYKTIHELEYFTAEEQEEYHEDALSAAKNLNFISCERVYSTKQGKISTLFSSKGFAIPHTEERGTAGIIVDITAQKELEKTLAQKVIELSETQKAMQTSKDRMQLMLDAMPLAAQIWSTDGQLLETSLEAARLFEFSDVHEYSKNFAYIHPEFQPNGKKSLEFIQELLQKALENGVTHAEWMHINKANETVPIDITAVRSTLHGETVILAFLRDLREHYANLEKLREADVHTKLMFDSNPLGTIIWDHNFNLVNCNKALALNFGLDTTDAFVEHFLTLFPEYQPDGMLSLEKMQNCLQECITKGHVHLSWMGLSIHGEEIPFNVKGVRTKYRGEYMLIAYLEDLRESEAQKKKLQIAEDRTKAILNGVPLGINLLRSDFTILDCNDVAVKLAKHATREAYIADFMNVMPPKQPDGKDTAIVIYEILTKAQQDGQTCCEIMAMDTEKNVFPVEITAVSAHLEHEEIYIAYVRDLRETKKMLREIELSKEAAEQSARAKSEFLANMSHEIRTPMHGILGLLHLINGTDLKPKQQNYLTKTLFSANNLLRIIDDILDFSKIEAGKLEIEATPFNINLIAKEIEDLYSAGIKEKGLDFTITGFSLEFEQLLGDPLRLKQVLFNLVSNAIKFTKQGSIDLAMQVTARTADTITCQFSVADTGIGISESQIQKLFSAFSQADTSVTRKYGGTGLGLAICRNLVQMMQGDIWIESVEGKGTTFFFNATFGICSDTQYLEGLANDFIDIEHGEGHLLLVEDNEINQLIALELLKDNGYTVDIANNGQEALDMLQEKQYDLVLMDIQMPVMDGLTATKRIRKMENFSTLPIIAMSAHAMTGDKEISLAHGMNDHITKPIAPEVLYQTLQYWLNQSKKSTLS